MSAQRERWIRMWDAGGRENRRQLILGEITARESRQRTVRMAIGLVLSAVPLWFVWLIVKSMAGKTTTFNVTVAVTVVVSLSLGEALMILRQRSELQRLRSRVRMIEAENRDLRHAA